MIIFELRRNGNLTKESAGRSKRSNRDVGESSLGDES